MLLHFNLSKSINSILIPILWIWSKHFRHHQKLLSLSRNNTFFVEQQCVSIIKVGFCITSRWSHFEACSSDFDWIILTINGKKTCFCKGFYSVLLLFLWISNAIATLSATSKVTFFIKEQCVALMNIGFCITSRWSHF